MTASGRALSNACGGARRASPGRAMAVALALALVLAVAAGCGSGDSPTTATRAPATAAPPLTGTTLSPNSDTAVTHVAPDADYRWSPAEALPAEDADAISALLAGRGLHLLFPSRAPVAQPGSVTAVFNAMHTIPTNRMWMSLIVFTKDQEKLLELEPVLTESSAPARDDTTVRGQTGRVYAGSEARQWTLTWVEEGQAYSASSQVLTVDEAVAWLETWYVLPDSQASGNVAWADIALYGRDNDYPRYSEGLVALQVDFKMGYLDTTGSWAIEPRFAEVRRFSEGLAAVAPGWGGPWGFVDRSGVIVVEPAFHACGDFHDGLAWAQVEEGGAYGFVDRTGAWVVRPTFDWAADFSEGMAAVRSAGDCGYIDPTGGWLIEPRFSDAGDFSGGLAPVQLEARGPYGYIGRTGAIVIEPQFARARVFSQGLAAVGHEGLWGFIDAKGDWVAEPRFAAAGDFSEGLAVVYSDGGSRCGYIDKTGAYAIEPKAVHGELFSGGLAPVTSDGGRRYIDTTGAYAFEGAYDVALPFSEGLAVVNLDIGSAQAKWAVIDTTGAFVWKLE